MPDFLTDQWFEDVNRRFCESLSAQLPEETSECRVVIELTDVPENLARALTLTVSTTGVEVTAGEGHDATATVRMSYVDAHALSTGQLDSASALREGRFKVRGDVTRLIPLTAWLQSAWAH